MGHQNSHYLKLKGQTYYYTRRVPKVLQKLTSITRFETCLHTSVRSVAVRQANLLSQELEDQWSILRRRQRNDQIARLFGGGHSAPFAAEGGAFQGPLLTDALETYLSLKGAGRPSTFEAGARRSIGYLLEASENKPLDAYVRTDANALREFLKERGLAQDSISRNLTNIRAVINFVMKEQGLSPSVAFSGVYLGEAEGQRRRYVPTTEELSLLQRLCKKQDDLPRWILALLSDTGLRLSEALGLAKGDVILETDTPHLIIRPHPWRRLKTKTSERVVPLVGMSLWAATRAYNTSQTSYLFPRYIRGQETLSNSASAALNKWLKKYVHNEMVVHSLRHAMRDRLRELECPVEVIDTIGGWARDGIGETYGKGYSLSVLKKWLMKLTSEA